MSNEDQPRAALILAGGGITGGVYELGVLSALDDFIVRGRRSGDFDHYVGISAGSLVAAFLANGIPVETLSAAILGTGDEELLLRREDIYSFRASAFLRAAWKFLRHTPAIMRHLRKTGQRVTFLNTIAYLQQFLPAGVFSNDNLERYVSRALSLKGRSNEFRNLHRELSIVAVEADSGERWVFGSDGTQDISISKAIQASTAIPVFFEPVRIGERFFIDGGAERVGHLDVALGAGARSFMEQFDTLKDCFSRSGREVSLDGLKTDRFLDLAASGGKRRRFSMPMHGDFGRERA